MDSKTEKTLAESLETETDLLPYMPYLLQDMWELGSSVELILKAINDLKLPPHSKILDLGCGKGAISIKIAKQFGLNATGVDAMEEFLQEAEVKSVDHNVEDQCQFIKQDMREFVKIPRDFDVVILASIGGIFGSWKDTIANLRTQVKSGGYIIIDDGYLKDKKSFSRKGYSHYTDHENSVKALTSFGDEIIAELDTTNSSIEINDQYMEVIEKRGQELVEQNPQLEGEIDWYIKNQYEECEVIENEIIGALWIMRKE